MELPGTGRRRKYCPEKNAIVCRVENCGSITFWKRDREKNGAGMGTGIW